jgi:hypothetical protein
MKTRPKTMNIKNYGRSFNTMYYAKKKKKDNEPFERNMKTTHPK